MLPLNPKALPVDELLIDGAYARAMFMPADTMVRGAAKQQEYITVVAKGEILVEEDGVTTTVVAPAMMKSPPNVERIIYAHTAAVLITFHATAAQSLADVADSVLCNSGDLLCHGQ